LEPKEIDPQEVLRAQFVIAKAIRDNLNLVEVLTSHMVSKTLIEELTGESPVWSRKEKQDKAKELKEWVQKNLSKELPTKEIATSLDCSYETAIKTIKENPFYFVGTRRGYYEIRDGEIEREQAKKGK
jgi:hypothetical protein